MSASILLVSISEKHNLTLFRIITVILCYCLLHLPKSAISDGLVPWVPFQMITENLQRRDYAFCALMLQYMYTVKLGTHVTHRGPKLDVNVCLHASL